MANIHTADRYDIDAGLASIRAVNDARMQKKADAMKEAKALGDRKQSQTHSYKYQRQDAAIKEFASLNGHRAPGTYLQSKDSVKVFCINCGMGQIYKHPKVSGSGRLLGRKRCRCGESTAVILSGFHMKLKRMIHG